MAVCYTDFGVAYTLEPKDFGSEFGSWVRRLHESTSKAVTSRLGPNKILLYGTVRCIYTYIYIYRERERCTLNTKIVHSSAQAQDKVDSQKPWSVGSLCL